MDECIIKYPNLPDLSQLNPVFAAPLVETLIASDSSTSSVSQISSCNLKDIPDSFYETSYPGNVGGNFPLTTECRLIEKILNEDCYLALELGDDADGDGDPLMQEDDFQFGDGRFTAPCLNDGPILEECFLAKEEDGATPFEMEENTNNFSVQCI